jgi:hypothetical protein
VEGQVVGVAGPAEQDELGREVPDPRELLELGQRLVAGQGPQPVAVQPADGGRLAQRAEVLHLAGEQPREPVEGGQAGRGGEGVADVAVHVHGLAQLVRHALLDPGRLHDPDSVPDQRPGGRLVG